MILVLHQHSHHHHHDHASKQCGPPMAGVESVGGTGELNSNVRIKKHTNINVRAAFIHVIGDLFQSIGVVTAAYIIRFKVHITCSFLWLMFKNFYIEYYSQYLHMYGCNAYCKD